MDSLVKDPEIRNKLATKLKTEIGNTIHQPTTLSLNLCPLYKRLNSKTFRYNQHTSITSIIEKVPSYVISVQLFLKDKLLVTILGLYADVSAETRFGQTVEINFFIARTVNASIFVVLGENFNENSSNKSVSFQFCLDLSLVNSLGGHYLTKTSMWNNLKRVEKIIDYIFVSKYLLLVIANHGVVSASDFFNTDYKILMISIGLDGLLNFHLNSLHK
ncbi:hypothetical protein G9A89_014141 [Geosiphon pyriformis]|nr:hypothetical protein G9A89_014141 [Geosiphon pyriformis]